MIKERVWPVRVMYMLIAAALAISLIITTAPALKVSAQTIPDAEWDLVSEDFVLAPYSYIIDIAVGDDGEVAYAILRGLSWNGTAQEYGYWLLKSDDHAATWENITDALEDELDEDDYINYLVRVACDPEDSEFVAVALEIWDDSDSAFEVHVFVSTDGGATFRDTGEVEDGGAMFPGGWYVTDLAVSTEDDDERDIAIVGSNGTAALILRSTAVGEFSTGWEDASYKGWDNRWTGDPDTTNDITSLVVTDVQFAPSWGADRTILVTTVVDEGGDLYSVYLQYGTWGTTEGWNEQSTLAMESTLIIGSENIPTCLGTSMDMQDYRGIAGITMPLDFAGRHSDKRVLWVWVNYYDSTKGNIPAGTIFRVKNGVCMGIGWQVEDEKVWLTNVSYLGYISEGKAIAGVLGTGGYAYNVSACANYYDIFTYCCEGVQVYRNDNIVNMDICCYDWDPACKPPTGTKAMAAFYVSDDPASSKAYAVALWSYYPWDSSEGAWSVSFDDGDVWNQLSLIDTHIDYLSDVEVSPDCNKMMLVSVNTNDCACNETEYSAGNCMCCGCDSVWLKAENLPEAEEYSGKWLRTWCDKLTDTDAYPHGFDEWGFLRLAPEETTGDTVYLVDYYTDIVYWNELETLGCWEDGTATVDYIVDLAVKDRETIYALDYDGTVAMSDDFALGWHSAVDSELDNGYTIAVWGDHILVGGLDADVSYSDDGGETFTKLEDVANSGYVTVAFDSYFDTNNTVYAALAHGGSNNGVYSFVIDESETWKDLRAQPTRDALCCCNTTYGCPDEIEVNFTGLVVDTADGNPMTRADTGGVLYASFCLESNPDITGVARRLNPAEETVCPTCVEWDYLIEGLPDHSDPGDCPEIGPCFHAIPDALKICGCLTSDTNSKLFAIDADDWGYDMWHPLDEEDNFDGGVWMFEDCYAKKAPDLLSPADGETIPSDPCECIPLPFTIRWDRLCDACSYDIQLALDEDFNEVIFDSRYMCPPHTETDPCCTYRPAEGETPSFYVMGHEYDDDMYLICEYTYYWRIRAADAATDQIIHSWWSEPFSFTVAPGPGVGVNLIAPENGAAGVALTNIPFSWSEVASADAYNWVLSANSDLSSPIATSEDLTNTAATYTGTALDYETPYFWQVTAEKEGEVISTSEVGTFTTAAAGQFCCPQCGLCFDTQAELQEHIEDMHAPVTPAWVWVVIAIGAVLVIVVIVLIFRTRRV